MSKRILLTSLSLSLLISHSALHAGGFGIIEHSASGMGNAFAGAAAVGEDASTVWFNPAAMSRLGDRPMVSQAGHIIIPSAKFTDRGSSVNPAVVGDNPALAVATLMGSDDEADKVAFVPNFYYVRPINEKMHFGLGINAPFGLEVSYKDDWIGRYIATNSEMLTININPALSWKTNNKLSFGAGVSAQYIDVTLGSAIDTPAACRGLAAAIGANPALAPTVNPGILGAQCLAQMPNVGRSATDSKAEITGDDLSYGYNLGVLFEPTASTRIGASYRSKIKHSLGGNADFTVNPILATVPTANAILQATSLKDRNVTAEATLPDSLSLSVAHKYNNRLELLADATWTGWSSFKELRVVDTTGSDVALTPENWDDTWRLSIGGNYKYSDKITLRTGVAYDETPIPSPELRTPRIPGTDRTWLTLGAGYKVNDHINVDIGYAHLFLDDAAINHTSHDNGYTIKGNYEADVNILSAQLNWKF